MITSLLKWTYAMDVELWTENGKLKYRAEQGVLTDEVKLQLIDNKEAVSERLDQNEVAKLKQWTTFEFGEMYSKRTAENAELCIIRNEDNTFMVWRASWKNGEAKPISEKTIVERAPFIEAMDRANNYYEWSSKNKRRKAS